MGAEHIADYGCGARARVAREGCTRLCQGPRVATSAEAACDKGCAGGAPKWAGGARVDAEKERGAPKLAQAAMRGRPLGSRAGLPRAHETREGCANVGRGRTAPAPPGAAGSLRGAIRARGASKWAVDGMPSRATRPKVECIMGPRCPREARQHARGGPARQGPMRPFLMGPRS